MIVAWRVWDKGRHCVDDLSAKGGRRDALPHHKLTSLQQIL